MQPTYELAHVLRAQWNVIEQIAQRKKINSWQIRTLSAISKCRTFHLGGHIDGCTNCKKLRISYNSCRNRHCPKCQGNERENWIAQREKELLPVAYFHVVFTLPSELNSFCMQHPKIMYDALFDAAWQTISAFSNDEKHLGAIGGMISILHTWGQQLTLHPHLHCIIPAGGITKNGKWKNSKTNGDYLFPVKALSSVFRAKYIYCIRKAVLIENKKREQNIILSREIINQCFKKSWVVYAKKPFSGVSSVVEYLGRYTHKIAISNHRITEINKTKNTVSFTYKDYKENGKKKQLTLSSLEFIRRFTLHILPKRLVRIRHYGILSSTSKKICIPLIRKQFKNVKVKSIKSKAIIYNPLLCHCCKKETMIQLLNFDLRGPPKEWKKRAHFLLNHLN